MSTPESPFGNSGVPRPEQPPQAARRRTQGGACFDTAAPQPARHEECESFQTSSDAATKRAAAPPAFPLDPDWRGVPLDAAGLSSADVSIQRWHPADGRMTLPLLSLDLATFAANRRAMFEVCAQAGAAIAPHAKTPMSPLLAADMVEHGAWGTSVADLRQAGVMLRHGLNRILIANEIGGSRAAERLAALLTRRPEAETFLFVDSADLIAALAATWRHNPGLPRLSLLIEVSCGRGGARTQAEVEALISACTSVDDARICLAGLATYEGTLNQPDQQAVRAGLDDLFGRLRTALAAVRRAVGPAQPLLVSAGGSTLFDFVLAGAASTVREDGNALLLLRSGSCYYGDHGAMPGRFAAIVARNLLGEAASARVAAFRPALRLWAEVLSVHDRTAICGLGLRDVAHDQGLPVPLAVWRDGRPAGDLSEGVAVTKLNDQHAFVDGAGASLAVGDVVEFGVRHPCTTIDKHDVIYGLGPDGTVRSVLRTVFG